ncbi:MAG TPA: hypothetical protein PKZ34_03705, partial [Thermotogota bacterium]|nr:hypothetical protein [Thermotogota bacterium]
NTSLRADYTSTGIFYQYLLGVFFESCILKYAERYRIVLCRKEVKKRFHRLNQERVNRTVRDRCLL